MPAPERRAYIKKVIARACPVPLTDAERDRAADFVMANAANMEAQWVAGKLDLLDAASVVCRSGKP